MLTLNADRSLQVNGVGCHNSMSHTVDADDTTTSARWRKQRTYSAGFDASTQQVPFHRGEDAEHHHSSVSTASITSGSASLIICSKALASRQS